ncbi:MAG TPA: hypothetical protein VEI97_19785 [bacterium]|nr:hypothetical protein [bacterium]
MKSSSLKQLGASALASLLLLNYPLAAFAAVTPPAGGQGGATVTGQVVDDEDDDGSRRGETIDDDSDRGYALWVLLGAGAALALLLDASLNDNNVPEGDCDELFPPGSIGDNTAQSHQEDCSGRNNAAAQLFSSLALGASTAGSGVAVADRELARDLLPFAVPESLDLATARQMREGALARVGQPAGVKVKVAMDEYVMAGKEVPATFTVTAAPGLDLSKQLYLVGADLALAGVFTQELGVPFAVPVDMDALRSTGTWSYTTPYEAVGNGSYYLDSYVSTELPAQLIPDTRGPSVIDAVQAQLNKVDAKLKNASATKARKLQAQREALNDHLIWLMEWDRHLHQ